MRVSTISFCASLALIASLFTGADSTKNPFKHFRNPFRTSLITATVNNDLKRVVAALEYGDDIHQTDSRGCTALLISFQKGYFDIFAFLLRHHAHIGHEDDECTFAEKISRATYYHTGKLSAIKAMEKNDRRFFDCFVIHKLLLNEVNFRGQTSLMTAIESDDFEAAQMLLNAGVDLEIRDDLGHTAYEYFLLKDCAARSGDPRRSHYDTLADAFGIIAQSHISNDVGKRVMFYSVFNDRADLVQTLLRHKFDMNYIHTLLETSPLIHAVQNQKNEIVSLIIQGGGDCALPDKAGIVPLAHAIQAKNIEACELLIECGGLVPLTPKLELPSLITLTHMYESADLPAGKHRALRVLGAILDNHAVDVNSSGGSLLNYVLKHFLFDCELWVLLLAHGASVETVTEETKQQAMRNFVSHCTVDRIELAVKAGFPLNMNSYIDRYSKKKSNLLGTALGRDILNQMTSNSTPAVIEYLLAQGADPNDAQLYGTKTIPIIAKGESRRKIVRSFISHGWDVNQKDESGMDMLYILLFKEKDHDFELARMLIQAGRYIDAMVRGFRLLETAVGDAVRTYRNEETSFLLRNGADMWKTDRGYLHREKIALFDSMKRDFPKAFVIRCLQDEYERRLRVFETKMTPLVARELAAASETLDAAFTMSVIEIIIAYKSLADVGASALTDVFLRNQRIFETEPNHMVILLNYIIPRCGEGSMLVVQHMLRAEKAMKGLPAAVVKIISEYSEEQ